MPESGTLTKAHIIDAVAEANGITRQKSLETVTHFDKRRITTIGKKT